MSLHPDPIGPVPDETVRIARAAFPRGSAAICMCDALGPIYDDARFADLFATRGRPVEAPWRLAFVTVLQFAEGLSDRQAAEAVRARIDWTYAHGLELGDSGFDFSILSEFRSRLVAGTAEHLVDAGYIRAANLVSSRTVHRINLVGPIYEDRQWQAKAGTGFDVAHFQVDWEQKRVTCPGGKTSVRWS